MSGLTVQPVGPAQLADLRTLFESARSTRHCWCMAFCSNSRQFAAGWYGGGNRRRFVELALGSEIPMGVLALVDGEPAGWCACGPRSRYLAGISGRSALLNDRPRDEDMSVWLIACLFVAVPFRTQGILLPMLRRAVALSDEQGAAAVEAWPLAGVAGRPGADHVGREGAFRSLGFTRVQEPSGGRVVMRLDFAGR